jgi:hypothetical protein
VLHHPTLLREFPENTVFLNWAYDREVAATPTETFALAKVRFLNCPGVSGWSRFANDIETASLNIRKMADYGRRFGAQGILTTDWGDCGHVNLLSGSYHGMAFGAALSWNSASYREMNEFDRAFSYLQYADQSGEIALLLRELGSLCSYHFGNLYAWAYDLECMWNKEQEIKTWKMATTERRFGRAGEIAKQFKAIAENRFAAKSFSQDLGEFTWSAEAIQWMLLLVGYKKETEFGERDSGWRIPDGQTIIAAGTSLLERFKALWLKRNKTSELRNVAAVFETVFRKVKSLPQQGRDPSQSS